MRTIVHLSDLHFGRTDPAVIQPLIDAIAECRPDVVVISGDLTQRARRSEFLQARAFLSALPNPQIVVPGNHDIPLRNVFARLWRPLDRYQRYISENLEPFYADAELAVVGVNTVRSLTIQNGRINEFQIAQACARLKTVARDVIRFVVTHHPFDLPEASRDKRVVGRSRPAMAALARQSVDAFLAGHAHVSYAGHTSRRYRISGYSGLIIQAGTATSTRGRGEANSFNLIRVDRPYLQIDCFTWQPARAAFAGSSSERFEQRPDGWFHI